MAVTITQYYLVQGKEENLLIKTIRPAYDNHRGDHEDFVRQLVDRKLNLIIKDYAERNDRQSHEFKLIGVYQDWDRQIDDIIYDLKPPSFTQLVIHVLFNKDGLSHTYIDISIDNKTEENYQPYEVLFINEKDIDMSEIEHYNLWGVYSDGRIQYW
jgi:hypothetical protein